MVQVWGLVEVKKLLQFRYDSSEELYGMSDCSYQRDSRFSQEFHCARLELSREYSMSQLCSILHDSPVTLHTPGDK